MIDGFIRVAVLTPNITVGDPVANREAICAQMPEAFDGGAKLLVFPELCMSGYTCQDLFLQSTLIDSCRAELLKLLEASRGQDALVVVGLPWERENRLYNVAAFFQNGKLLALVPKRFIPNYGEFYERRYFAEGNERAEWISFPDPTGQCVQVPFGTDILLRCDTMPELVVAAEICEDIWVPCPPSIRHAMAGATVIMNLSASNETTGKAAYRRELVVGQSARLICGYLYASAGEGESTQDLVFSGHNLISENGTLLAESKRFGSGILYGELDLDRLRSERRRMGTFGDADADGYVTVPFQMERVPLQLQRRIAPNPFVPADQAHRSERCEEILSMQAAGLKKRLEHTHCTHAVVGISGGLDSTLALLVIVRAFDSLHLSRDGIIAVTMPGFGTTDRTYRNACELTKRLGATLSEVDIRASVTQHFADIGHDSSVHDVTYENGQARERTQVLMDLANQCGGLVIGTGDLSELALGWATYNGDHMSMYGVNASVPKTLVRHLVRFYADTCGKEALAAILYDVLDTPVSPELLPPEDGVISQKTEDLVGPYELHDFFLYQVLRFGYHPRKIYRMAKLAYAGAYGDETILKWMKVFYRRFFAQQFKRSCLPDGPKVGSAAVSPRGDLRMPSDASGRIWLEELELLSADSDLNRDL